MLCFVLINSIFKNCLCVWIWFINSYTFAVVFYLFINSYTFAMVFYLFINSYTFATAFYLFINGYRFATAFYLFINGYRFAMVFSLFINGYRFSTITVGPLATEPFCWSKSVWPAVGNKTGPFQLQVILAVSHSSLRRQSSIMYNPEITHSWKRWGNIRAAVFFKKTRNLGVRQKINVKHTSHVVLHTYTLTVNGKYTST